MLDFAELKIVFSYFSMILVKKCRQLLAMLQKLLLAFKSPYSSQDFSY